MTDENKGKETDKKELTDEDLSVLIDKITVSQASKLLYKKRKPYFNEYYKKNRDYMIIQQRKRHAINRKKKNEISKSLP